MKKRMFSIALVAAALILIVVNFLMPTRERTPIRVAILSNLIASLPHWVAMENGYYADEGIEPKEYLYTDSSLLVTAMASDEVDYLPGVSTLDVLNGVQKFELRPLFISHSRISVSEPFDSLLVTSGSSIANIRQLEGKRVAVYPGTTSREVLSYFLTEKGVDVSTVDFRPLPPPQHLQALQSGDVDCTHTYEPFRTRSLEGQRTRELFGSVYASLVNPCPIGCTIISQKLWVEDNESALKLIRVWDRSISFIREHPRQAREVLQRRLNISNSVASNATWVDATLSSELDEGLIRELSEKYISMRLLNEQIILDTNYFFHK